MSRPQWSLLILLVASIFINYIDRGNLSIAAPLLEKELGLSPLQMGSLLAAFFWTYALFQLFGFAGWLADRFPVGLVLASGFLIWSAATIATGLVSGFALLFGARLLVGAGEALAYPCYSAIFARDIPQEYRGRANALLDAGSKFGPAVGAFLSGILLVRLGWRLFFIVLGIGSLLWLVPWLKWMPKSCAMTSGRSENPPSVLDMLKLRSAWGTFCGHFCGNYFWFFLLTWLPTYLVRERNFSILTMTRITSVALLSVAAATLFAGWLSDKWITGGGSPTLVRKTVVVSGLAFSSVILPVGFVQSPKISLGFLIVSCLAFGAYTSNHWAITQTLAGPVMAGRWTSLQNGIGNVSGILAPWLAGLIVQASGSSKLAFVLSAAIAALGALSWGVIVGPVEQISWSNRRR